MGNWDWEGARETIRSLRAFVFFPLYHSTLDYDRGLCGEERVTPVNFEIIDFNDNSSQIAFLKTPAYIKLLI